MAVAPFVRHIPSRNKIGEATVNDERNPQSPCRESGIGKRPARIETMPVAAKEIAMSAARKIFALSRKA